MEKILKLKIKKNDKGDLFDEHETPSRLIMIDRGQNPLVDKFECLYNGKLYKEIFPFSIDGKYKTCNCGTPYASIIGGVLLQEDVVLTKDDFFKHPKTKPNKWQQLGCEQGKCVEQEEEEGEIEYEELDKKVVMVINEDYVGSIIFLKDIENED